MGRTIRCWKCLDETNYLAKKANNLQREKEYSTLLYTMSHFAAKNAKKSGPYLTIENNYNKKKT